MADPELLRQLSEELCICKSCGRPPKHPKCLPCLHSFCAECIEQAIARETAQNGKSSFPCPQCGQTTAVEPGNRQDSYVIKSSKDDVIRDDTFIEKLTDVIGAYNDAKSCDICTRHHIDAPAMDWCMDCFDALCDACTKVHLHGKTTAEHTVISLEEMRRLSLENIMKKKRPVPCSRHEGELIKLYCMDCKEVLCVQCVAISHRKCENCLTISDAMKLREDDFADVALRMETHQMSGGVPGALDDAGEVLEETVLRSRDRIKELAANLRQRIDESEEKLLQELEEVSDDLRKKIGSGGPPRKAHARLIQTAGSRMQALMKYGSDVEILRVVDKVKDALHKIEGVTENGEPEDEPMFRINFAVETPVKLFSRDFTTLGEIQVEDCNSDEGLSSWGVACTEADEIIVTDCRNKRVQKFSSEGDLIDHIQVSEEPRDITSCGSDEVAIVIKRRLIFFVTTTGALALKKRTKTEKQYDGISYSAANKVLLVSCLADKSIDVITLEGQILNSFNVDSTGQPIFLEPRYVCFSREGNYLVTDVARNTVKCITPDGRLIFSYTPDGAHVLRKPQDLCVDKLGNVFIADYASSRIQLISNQGYFQRFVLARESGLVRPVAIHMTSNNKLMVVQSDGMVKVFSYD